MQANGWTQSQDGCCCRRKVRLGSLLVVLAAVAGSFALLGTRVWAAGAALTAAELQGADSPDCAFGPKMEVAGLQRRSDLAPDTITGTVSLASLVACTRTGSDVPQWAWTSESGYGTVQLCGLYVPSDGQLFVAANASTEVLDQSYEALLAIGIDSQASPEAGTLRYVNVYRADPGTSSERLGSARPAAISLLRSVPAGYHYVSFLARRYHGPGTVWLRYPTLSAIFIPTDSDVRTCQVHADQDWQTGVSDHFVTVGGLRGGPFVQCTVSIPNRNGYLFISADASVGEDWRDVSGHGDYQGYFRVSVDGLNDLNSDRMVNIYNYRTEDDGTDKTVALTVLRQVNPEQLVKPGMDHTVYLAARREASSAATLLNVKDPTLSVIFLPDSGFTAHTCGSPPPPHPGERDGDYWSRVGRAWVWGSYSFGNIRQCTAGVPAGGWAFVSASASAARLPSDCDLLDPAVCGAYQAEFRLGVDTMAGAEDTNRRLDIYDDPDWSTLPSEFADGSDDTAAITVLKPLALGQHTFYFVGRRLNQVGGEAFLLYPNLTVIVPNSRVFMPITLEP